MFQMITRSRAEKLKRALAGESTWLVPTSRARLLKVAVSPKSPGQKRVEGVLQELASSTGKAKSLAKLAAGGTAVYLASKAVGGAGAVVFDASRRRIQSVTGSDGASRSGSSGGGGNSSARKSSAKSTRTASSASRSQSSSGTRKSTGNRKTATRKKPAARKKTTARKKSTGRKKTTTRRS
jgi:hypothetical protein